MVDMRRRLCADSSHSMSTVALVKTGGLPPARSIVLNVVVTYMVQLTKERLRDLETPNGGTTWPCMKALGVQFVNGQPLPWRHLLVDTLVTDEKWTEIKAASSVYGKTPKKTPGISQAELFG